MTQEPDMTEPSSAPHTISVPTDDFSDEADPLLACLSGKGGGVAFQSIPHTGDPTCLP